MKHSRARGLYQGGTSKGKKRRVSRIKKRMIKEGKKFCHHDRGKEEGKRARANKHHTWGSRRRPLSSAQIDGVNEVSGKTHESVHGLGINEKRAC